ncbi:hypothetical protein NBH81_08965 [Aeromonas veronii]|uniref:hypothetical protein n=1 Tax=Aeromonas veronii TaxID=654 RepID=UPI0021D9A484|nr:hypothetical protein [Aeromonas veronii]UYB72572.1 hypothetical protein NBH81_08965 [Aeromonas veronii]
MESNNPLVHLALLESLKDNKISDEIDLFLPFIAVILSEIAGDEITPHLLQDKFAQSFGVEPPISAIKVFITRAKKRKLLHRENNAYFQSSEQVEKWKNGFYEKKDDIETSLSILRNDFKYFANEHFGKVIEDYECDFLLNDFIGKNISSVTSVNAFEKNQLHSKIKNTDHVTASFISHIHKTKSSSLDHFSRIVKGMVLANYLCFADKVGSKKQYDSITVYLDTPIILGLLGFSGSQKKKSSSEFVSLLKKIGIKLRLFDKSLDEAQMLMGAWRDDLRKRNYNRFNSKTLELLKTQGYDAERLDTEIKLLKSTIENEGIKIETDFHTNQKYQCDEKALEAAISENFKHNKNLEHDTICISRVYNLREGHLISNLNQKMSIFVTPNTGLVNYANDFFRGEISPKHIPLVVSEQWMTTMFWLKGPDIFNSLPMDQIVASAYGLLYTDDRFWHSFICRLQQLEKRGGITEDEFTFVRWDSDLLGLIHYVSVDVGEDFSESDIFEIVEKIKEKHYLEKDVEIYEIQKSSGEKIKILQSEVAESKSALDVTKRSVLRASNTSGACISFVLCLILVGCVFWTLYCTLPTDIVNNSIVHEYKRSFLTVAAIFITFLFNLMAALFGCSIISVYKWIRKSISEWLYEALTGNKSAVSSGTNKEEG